MNKFLYIDEDNILYDRDMNVIDRKEHNTYELLNKHGFSKDEVNINSKSIGMKFIGAKSKNEDAVILIKVNDDTLTNFHFKEEVNAIYSKDNNTWYKFYDIVTYNEAVRDISMRTLVSSEMSILEKNQYMQIKNVVESVKDITTVKNLGFKFILLKLKDNQYLNAVYEILRPTKDYAIQVRPKIISNREKFTISELKDTDTLRVNISKSSDKLKNTLKEF